MAAIRMSDSDTPERLGDLERCYKRHPLRAGSWALPCIIMLLSALVSSAFIEGTNWLASGVSSLAFISASVWSILAFRRDLNITDLWIFTNGLRLRLPHSICTVLWADIASTRDDIQTYGMGSWNKETILLMMTYGPEMEVRIGHDIRSHKQAIAHIKRKLLESTHQPDPH
jgi:hypothetical protein